MKLFQIIWKKFPRNLFFYLFFISTVSHKPRRDKMHEYQERKSCTKYSSVRVQETNWGHCPDTFKCTGIGKPSFHARSALRVRPSYLRSAWIITWWNRHTHIMRLRTSCLRVSFMHKMHLHEMHLHEMHLVRVVMLVNGQFVQENLMNVQNKSSISTHIRALTWKCTPCCRNVKHFFKRLKK